MSRLLTLMTILSLNHFKAIPATDGLMSRSSLTTCTSPHLLKRLALSFAVDAMIGYRVKVIPAILVVFNTITAVSLFLVKGVCKQPNQITSSGK